MLRIPLGKLKRHFYQGRKMKKLSKIVLGTFLALSLVSGSVYAGGEDFSKKTTIFEAQSGHSLVDHPKIKPDGKNYYLTSTFYSIVDEDDGNYRFDTTYSDEMVPSHVVLLLHSPDSRAFKRLAGDDEGYIALYKRAYKNFVDTARVGRRLYFVGKYVKNWKNLLGETRPTFEVLYIETEDSPFGDDLLADKKENSPTAQLTSANQPAHQPQETQQAAQENIPSMVDLIEEAQTELAKEDKRLNAEWKAVMSMLTPEQKKELRKKQRAWIKARDENCKLEEDSGQAGSLEHFGCLREMTQKRADELEAMRK